MTGQINKWETIHAETTCSQRRTETLHASSIDGTEQLLFKDNRIEEKGTILQCKNLTNANSSSLVMFTACTLEMMWWKWHCTPVIVLPKPHDSKSNQEEQYQKNTVLWGIPTNIWPVHLKTFKVKRNKESLRNSHKQEEPNKPWLNVTGHPGREGHKVKASQGYTNKSWALITSVYYGWLIYHSNGRC